MDNVELKKKVTLKRKGEGPSLTSLSQPKKSKWWLWLIPIFIIGVIVLILKFNPSGTDNNTISAENESTPVEQTSVTSDGAMTDVQNGNTENSQSNSDQGQVTTTTPESKSTTPSDNSNKTSSSVTANTESTGTSSVSNAQKPKSSAQMSANNSVDDKAWEVIKGSYGNGDDRKQMLGAEYESIQQRVNELYKTGQVQ